MNIYFDFEATQFSERVIAIGASCEYGDFDCLVSLCKGDKLTPFITNLTGITKEMLTGAPSADEAFSDLYSWISAMCAEAETPIFYHCFGDSDAIFLKNTARKITDPTISTFINNLAASLIDDSSITRQYFHSKSIGLHKALKFFEPELLKQTHDPLDDAILLQRLMEHLTNAEPLTECPYEECRKQEKKKQSEQSLQESQPTSNYYIEATSIQHPESKPKCFNNYRAAFDWCIAKVHKKDILAKPITMEKNCKKAIDENGRYLDRTWRKVLI